MCTVLELFDHQVEVEKYRNCQVVILANANLTISGPILTVSTIFSHFSPHFLPIFTILDRVLYFFSNMGEKSANSRKKSGKSGKNGHNWEIVFNFLTLLSFYIIVPSFMFLAFFGDFSGGGGIHPSPGHVPV